MKRLISTMLVFILLTIVPLTAAADCPTLVKQALAVTEGLCKETENNQACYGNIRLQAKPTSQAENFVFSKPGDHANIADIKSLQLSPMTLDTGEWGVALMHVQANLPDTSPNNLLLLAFGDVFLENAVPVPTILDGEVGNDFANARWLPNTNSRTLIALKPSQKVTVIERLADNSWLRINLPDDGETGWVKTELLNVKGDLNTLRTANATQPYYRPMQAFTFKSGTSSGQGCAEVPQDGLLIQTPEGAGEVQLWINQVVIKLGSTVYFQAQPDGDMTVTTLEGHATVEALGVSYTAIAGSSIYVKLDGDMQPISTPSLPQAYNMGDVQNLPIENLQRKISIHPPLTEQEIISIDKSQSNRNNFNCPGNSCHNGTNNNNGNGGNSDNKNKDNDKGNQG
jgi:hypothetical protein